MAGGRYTNIHPNKMDDISLPNPARAIMERLSPEVISGIRDSIVDLLNSSDSISLRDNGPIAMILTTLAFQQASLSNDLDSLLFVRNACDAKIKLLRSPEDPAFIEFSNSNRALFIGVLDNMNSAQDLFQIAFREMER